MLVGVVRRLHSDVVRRVISRLHQHLHVELEPDSVRRVAKEPVRTRRPNGLEIGTALTSNEAEIGAIVGRLREMLADLANLEDGRTAISVAAQRATACSSFPDIALPANAAFRAFDPGLDLVASTSCCSPIETANRPCRVWSYGRHEGNPRSVTLSRKTCVKPPEAILQGSDPNAPPTFRGESLLLWAHGPLAQHTRRFRYRSATRLKTSALPPRSAMDRRTPHRCARLRSLPGCKSRFQERRRIHQAARRLRSR